MAKVSNLFMIIFIFLFMLVFISIMVTVVFNMVGLFDDDFGPPIWMFIPFILIFVLVIVAILYSVISSIRTAKKGDPYSNQPYTRQDPMSYERKQPLNYCKFCGANLGTTDPEICPECKNKLKNDFYH